MRVRILGSGGSGGVPLVGNRWGSCDPHNPKNRRLRPSLLVEEDATLLLIDTTPDLRIQLLEAEVTRLDAVIYTHAHADHCHGIDDLREICRLIQGPLDCYADAQTIDKLIKKFEYCFQTWDNGPINHPVLVGCCIEGCFRVGAIEVVPFVQDHGFSMSLGYRFGDVAYSVDVKRLDDKGCDVLAGLEVWIVDCVRVLPKHPVHFVLEDVLDYVARLCPRRTILTHLSTEIDYDTLSKDLPRGVEVAYDGMMINL